MRFISALIIFLVTLTAYAPPLPPAPTIKQPAKKVFVLSSPKDSSFSVPMRGSSLSLLTTTKVIVRPANTNTYSLNLLCDPYDPIATNVTLWVTNQQGMVTSTNAGLVTNLTVHGLSPTNHYWIVATVQNPDGQDILFEPGLLGSSSVKVLEWRPPLNWFLTLSTVPACASLCLTNPVAGFQCYRTSVSGTNGAFECAPSLSGPWAPIGSPFVAQSNQAFRLAISLTNDLSTALAKEVKE